jgi:hypothetical protein
MTQRHHHRTCRGILAGTVILPLGLFSVRITSNEISSPEASKAVELGEGHVILLERRK